VGQGLQREFWGGRLTLEKEGKRKKFSHASFLSSLFLGVGGVQARKAGMGIDWMEERAICRSIQFHERPSRKRGPHSSKNIWAAWVFWGVNHTSSYRTKRDYKNARCEEKGGNH